MSKHPKDSKAKEDQTPSAQAAGQEPAQGQGLTDEEILVPVASPEYSAGAADQSASLGAGQAAGLGAASVLEIELEAAAKEIETLKAELAELNEKYLRKLAEEVNFRKRMQREKDEALKFGAASLLADLVPVLDDFDRGIASAEQAKNYDQVHEGILLIRRQLSQMLENKYALKRFESKGQPFDPNRHEALFAEPAEVEEPTVSEEYLCGYSLHDRILRPAKVRVKVPAPRKAEEAPRPPEGGQDTADKA